MLYNLGMRKTVIHIQYKDSDIMTTLFPHFYIAIYVLFPHSQDVQQRVSWAAMNSGVLELT